MAGFSRYTDTPMKQKIQLAVFALLLGVSATTAFAQGDTKRGEYLAKAGGCLGCHTEDKKDATPFAGGAR